MRKKRTVNPLKETTTLLEKAVAKLDEGVKDNLFHTVYVCLDCNKVTTDSGEMWKCFNENHTYFILKHGDYFVFSILKCLRWILRKTEI